MGAASCFIIFFIASICSLFVLSTIHRDPDYYSHRIDAKSNRKLITVPSEEHARALEQVLSDLLIRSEHFFGFPRTFRLRTTARGSFGRKRDTSGLLQSKQDRYLAQTVPFQRLSVKPPDPRRVSFRDVTSGRLLEKETVIKGFQTSAGSSNFPSRKELPGSWLSGWRFFSPSFLARTKSSDSRCFYLGKGKAPGFSSVNSSWVLGTKLTKYSVKQAEFPDLPPQYLSHMYGKGNGAWSVSIPVSHKKTYTVILGFAEILNAACEAGPRAEYRIFRVTVGNSSQLIDLMAEVGCGRPYELFVRGVKVPGPFLTILLEGVNKYAVLSTACVQEDSISMPSPVLSSTPLASRNRKMASVSPIPSKKEKKELIVPNSLYTCINFGANKVKSYQQYDKAAVRGYARSLDLSTRKKVKFLPRSYQSSLEGKKWVYRLKLPKSSEYRFVIGFVETFWKICRKKSAADIRRRVFNLTVGNQEQVVDVFSKAGCYSPYQLTFEGVRSKKSFIDISLQASSGRAMMSALCYSVLPRASHPYISESPSSVPTTPVFSAQISPTLGTTPQPPNTDTKGFYCFRFEGAPFEKAPVDGFSDVKHSTSDDELLYYSDAAIKISPSSPYSTVYQSHLFGPKFDVVIVSTTTQPKSVVFGFAEIFKDNCVRGKRVFQIQIGAISRIIDVFDEVGCDTAFNVRFDGVSSKSGEVRISFKSRRGNAMISGICIQDLAEKVNVSQYSVSNFPSPVLAGKTPFTVTVESASNGPAPTSTIPSLIVSPSSSPPSRTARPSQSMSATPSSEASQKGKSSKSARPVSSPSASLSVTPTAEPSVSASALPAPTAEASMSFEPSFSDALPPESASQSFAVTMTATASEDLTTSFHPSFSAISLSPTSTETGLPKTPRKSSNVRPTTSSSTSTTPSFSMPPIHSASPSSSNSGSSSASPSISIPASISITSSNSVSPSISTIPRSSESPSTSTVSINSVSPSALTSSIASMSPDVFMSPSAFLSPDTFTTSSPSVSPSASKSSGVFVSPVVSVSPSISFSPSSSSFGALLSPSSTNHPESYDTVSPSTSPGFSSETFASPEISISPSASLLSTTVSPSFSEFPEFSPTPSQIYESLSPSEFYPALSEQPQQSPSEDDSIESSTGGGLGDESIGPNPSDGNAPIGTTSTVPSPTLVTGPSQDPEESIPPLIKGPPDPPLAVSGEWRDVMGTSPAGRAFPVVMGVLGTLLVIILLLCLFLALFRDGPTSYTYSTQYTAPGGGYGSTGAGGGMGGGNGQIKENVSKSMFSGGSAGGAESGVKGAVLVTEGSSLDSGYPSAAGGENARNENNISENPFANYAGNRAEGREPAYGAMTGYESISNDITGEYGNESNTPHEVAPGQTNTGGNVEEYSTTYQYLEDTRYETHMPITDNFTGQLTQTAAISHIDDHLGFTGAYCPNDVDKALSDETLEEEKLRNGVNPEEMLAEGCWGIEDSMRQSLQANNTNLLVNDREGDAFEENSFDKIGSRIAQSRSNKDSSACGYEMGEELGEGKFSGGVRNPNDCSAQGLYCSSNGSNPAPTPYEQDVVPTGATVSEERRGREQGENPSRRFIVNRQNEETRESRSRASTEEPWPAWWSKGHRKGAVSSGEFRDNILDGGDLEYSRDATDNPSAKRMDDEEMKENSSANSNSLRIDTQGPSDNWEERPDENLFENGVWKGREGLTTTGRLVADSEWRRDSDRERTSTIAKELDPEYEYLRRRREPYVRVVANRLSSGVPNNEFEVEYQWDR